MGQQFIALILDPAVDPASLAWFLKPSGLKDSKLHLLWYWAAIHPNLCGGTKTKGREILVFLDHKW